MLRLGADRIGVHLRSLDLLTALAVLVLILGSFQLFAGALRSGITTDEPTQLDRTQSWLTHGWYVPATSLIDGEPRDDLAMSPYVYGPAAGALAHAANAILGNEPWGDVASDESSWDVRHLVIAAIGLWTAVLVGVAVWLLVGSVRAGIWGAATLLAIPLWTGMSFFNIKDVPVAAGYTSFTVGLMVAVRSWDTDGPRSKAWTVAAVALVGTGTTLGVGTRPALWVALGASLLTFLGLSVRQVRAKTITARPRRAILAVGLGLAVGIALLILLYPKAFSHPLELLSQSFSISSDYPYAGFTLTAGHLLEAHPPKWYLPAWGFASIPVLILAFAIVASGRAIWRIGAALRNHGWAGLLTRSAGRQLTVVLVLQQALLLPIAAMIKGSTMYSGFRQHLYVVPAVAILSGVGAWWLRSRAGSGRSGRGIAATACLICGLAVPMTEQSILFPYNYTYVNPIAGLRGVNGQWESDYWGSSMREALSRVPPGAVPMCGGGSPTGPRGVITLVRCSLAPTLNPFLDERNGTASSGRSRPWVIAGRRAAYSPPDMCEEIDNVTRWLRGEQVIMSYVLRCDKRATAIAPVR
jgi:hypothetical protein